MQIPLNHDIQILSRECFELLRWRALDVIGHVPHNNLELAMNLGDDLSEVAASFLTLDQILHCLIFHKLAKVRFIDFMMTVLYYEPSSLNILFRLNQF
jgi:hypothetical protein